MTIYFLKLWLDTGVCAAEFGKHLTLNQTLPLVLV